MGVITANASTICQWCCSSAHSASHSTESLDEASTSLVDLEDETEMVLMAEMAEAWSVTVDKKTLKKMTAKDIKRQDHIWGQSTVGA